VAAVAAVATASAVTIAQAAPKLPARTPAQLLAALASRSAPPPLTGTVVETASLGIPQLPGAASPTSITSLLAGSHTLKIWYGGPKQIRLAAPVQMGETDFIRNGTTAWLWQSSTNSATRILIPPQVSGEGDLGKPAVPHAPLTPQQAAKQVLAAVGPSTLVTTQSNVTVAGQAAYQLVLAPRDSRSLVGKVTIAVDGQHPGVPLRVQVFARGASSPAFQVGYTSISFVRPAPANFAFTPPHGAQVRTVKPFGSGWHANAPLTGHRHLSGQVSYGRGAAREHLAAGSQIIGRDWLSVAVLPESALSGLAGAGNAANAAGQAARSVSGNGGSVDSAAILAALLQSAHPVHGTWGSGKLLRTSLVSILITSNGHVLVGAVTPGVLYAAAAQVK